MEVQKISWWKEALKKLFRAAELKTLTYNHKKINK